MRKPLVALALFAVALSVLAARADGPTFEQLTLEVGSKTAEPMIAVDRSIAPNAAYVVAPHVLGTPDFWRSVDGGHTWEHGAAVALDGDAAVSVDADGAVYLASLFSEQGGMQVSTSLDHGATIARQFTAEPGGYDREWLVAHGHGHVVLAADRVYDPTSLDTNIDSPEVAFVSDDAAQTFDGPFVIGHDVMNGGQMVYAPDGTLYMPFFTPRDIELARSDDGGRTWTDAVVASLGAGLPQVPLVDQSVIFPSAGVDTNGTVYVTWAEALKPAPFVSAPAILPVVKIARSADGGTTWSAPAVISDPNAQAIFPWIVAGPSGHVAVVFYQSRGPAVSPEVGTPLTTWDLALAHSIDAGGPSPSYTLTTVASGVHTGGICTLGGFCLGVCTNVLGLGCPSVLDRSMLDFFNVDSDAGGNLLVTYPKDGATGKDIMVARQIAGDPL